jgi:lanosterol synthase
MIGPLFLIPGLIIAMYVCGEEFTPEQGIELRRYILNKRRDRGWGL